MFTWWLFDEIQDFYDMYDEFCQSPSTCSTATSILVYCALSWLLEGNPVTQRAGIDMSPYAAYVPICHRHLATYISSYNLFLEPTDTNIAALSAAVSGNAAMFDRSFAVLTEYRPHTLSIQPILMPLGLSRVLQRVCVSPWDTIA